MEFLLVISRSPEFINTEANRVEVSSLFYGSFLKRATFRVRRIFWGLRTIKACSVLEGSAFSPVLVSFFYLFVHVPWQLFCATGTSLPRTFSTKSPSYAGKKAEFIGTRLAICAPCTGLSPGGLVETRLLCRCLVLDVFFFARRRCTLQVYTH